MAAPRPGTGGTNPSFPTTGYFSGRNYGSPTGSRFGGMAASSTTRNPYIEEDKPYFDEPSDEVQPRNPRDPNPPYQIGNKLAGQDSPWANPYQDLYGFGNLAFNRGNMSPEEFAAYLKSGGVYGAENPAGIQRPYPARVKTGMGRYMDTSPFRLDEGMARAMSGLMKARDENRIRPMATGGFGRSQNRSGFMTPEMLAAKMREGGM